MDIEEFLDIIKRTGPNVKLKKDPSVGVLVNHPEIPVRAGTLRGKECMNLKIYYDDENHTYRYCEDGEHWTDISEDELIDIFYNDIKPFVA